MLNKILLSVTCTLLVGMLAGCNSDDSENKGQKEEEIVDSKKKVSFTILHTNDNHGRFWHNADGEYGMAARKTLIDRIRAEVEAEGNVALVLSGGDVNTGVPESDIQDAEPDFKGMNAIQYDAMAVGNHEFDNPLTVLEKQRSWASFPMLSANIYKTGGGRYFEPYKVFDINGVNLALIGFTTEDTVKIGNPEYISELTFTDPKVEAPKIIAEINAKGEADIIMAVTHMGHYADAKNGSNAPGDVALARSLPEGALDAIIGGHSQNPVCMEAGNQSYADFKPGDDCAPDQQNGTYIMQAHEWGKYVGRADFEYQDGKLTLINYKLIPVNLKQAVVDESGNETGDLEFIQPEITKDPELFAELEVFQKKGEAGLDVKLAETDGKLEGDRGVVRYQQTNLGRLIAMAQSTRVKADFAVMNSGGVRASIEAGDISYRDVLTVQPFGNSVSLATMTGAEVKEYLAGVATKTRGSGAYAQISGVNMTVYCPTSTVEISAINGATFDESTEYTFTIPSFNAAGGDGYPVISTIDSGFIDADVLQGFFKDKGMINAADYNPNGEIVYSGSSTGLGCDAT